MRYFSALSDRANTYNSLSEANKLQRLPEVLCWRACILGLIVLGASAGGVLGQADSAAGRLLAGDSIRVNGTVVGRVLSVEGNTFTLLSRGKPICRAGEMHGEAPICDPAPIQRRTLLFGEVSLERRMEKGNPALWTLGGAMLGGLLVMFFLLSLQCHARLVQVSPKLGQVTSRECVLSIKLGCQCQLCQVSPMWVRLTRGAYTLGST